MRTTERVVARRLVTSARRSSGEAWDALIRAAEIDGDTARIEALQRARDESLDHYDVAESELRTGDVASGRAALLQALALEREAGLEPRALRPLACLPEPS